jgi:hypothetical protein
MNLSTNAGHQRHLDTRNPASWSTSGYWLENSSDGLLHFNIGNPSGSVVVDGRALRINAWEHIAIVYDKDEGFIRLYMNNTLEGEEEWSEGIVDSGRYLMISERNDLHSEYTRGKLDDIRIYSQGLTVAQVESLYYAGLNNLFAKGLITETEYQQRSAIK